MTDLDERCNILLYLYRVVWVVPDRSVGIDMSVLSMVIDFSTISDILHGKGRVGKRMRDISLCISPHTKSV
jgi:hypothetical protein